LVQGLSRQKVGETPPSQQKSGIWWCKSVILATLEVEREGLLSEASPDKNKLKQKKKDWEDGSSSRSLAWQVQGPEFKPKYQEQQQKSQANKQNAH
jgi:hypothetical protein